MSCTDPTLIESLADDFSEDTRTELLKRLSDYITGYDFPDDQWDDPLDGASGPSLHAVFKDLYDGQLTKLLTHVADECGGGGGGGQTDTVAGQDGITNAGNDVDAVLEPDYGVAANTVCEGNDARLSDARVPMGPAGGGLGGNYPNPTVTPAADLDTTAVHDNVAAEINAVAAKAAPVAADLVLIEDSADAFNKKKATLNTLLGSGGWTYDMDFTGTTHDFTGGATDPVTGLVPGGAFADFDVLQRETNRIRVVFNNLTGMIKQATLTLTFSSFTNVLPWSTAPSTSISVRMLPNDLTGNFTGAYYRVSDGNIAAGGSSQLGLIHRPALAGRVILHRIVRNGITNTQYSGVIANWQQDGWAKLHRVPGFQEAAHTQATALFGYAITDATDIDAAVFPANKGSARIVDGDYALQIALYVDVGGSIELDITRLILVGVPYAQ